MVITAEMLRQDFEVISEELKRRREELAEVETTVYNAPISNYGTMTGGKPAQKADDVSIRAWAVEKRQRAIAQLERQLVSDIQRIRFQFKDWEQAEELLRQRFLFGKTVDESAELVFGVRRFGCDHWERYRRRAFRLEAKAFETIAAQVR